MLFQNKHFKGQELKQVIMTFRPELVSHLLCNRVLCTQCEAFGLQRNT